MKNGIIILLALICIFFLLNALGVFQFGSIIDRNHRTWYENMREKAVRKSPALKLGTAYDRTDQPAAEAIQGVELAMEMLNREGGVLGRKLELVKRDGVTTLPQYSAAVQEFCDDPLIRVLPLISPLTVSSEKLPPLDPDNFVTFFPPLELWIEAILGDMEKKGYRNLLIISPETGTYGDIFCTALERMSHQRPAFNRVYRLNYQLPLRRRDLLRAVRNYSGEQFSNVVFFGGTFSDFPEFAALMKELKMTLPVYGSDDLYIPQTRNMALPFTLFLPRAVIRKQDTPFVKEWKRRFGKEPSYHTVLGAESIFAIAKALKKDGGYAPQKLVESLREIRKQRLNDPETAPEIVVDPFADTSKKS